MAQKWLSCILIHELLCYYYLHHLDIGVRTFYKIDYAELENALGIAMQDVAAGKPILEALSEVEQVSAEMER